MQHSDKKHADLTTLTNTLRFMFFSVLELSNLVEMSKTELKILQRM